MNESYEDGREARQFGMSLGSNPHPIGTRSHREWDKGWIDKDEELS